MRDRYHSCGQPRWWPSSGCCMPLGCPPHCHKGLAQGQPSFIYGGDCTATICATAYYSVGTRPHPAPLQPPVPHPAQAEALRGQGHGSFHVELLTGKHEMWDSAMMTIPHQPVSACSTNGSVWRVTLIGTGMASATRNLAPG